MCEYLNANESNLSRMNVDLNNFLQTVFSMKIKQILMNCI
jgi:hypothetical protein